MTRRESCRPVYFVYVFTIGRQESMILSISERITFLSMEIQTLVFLIPKDMVCTFFLSSQINSTSPRLLSKNPSMSVFIAMCDNWYLVFFAFKSGFMPDLLLYESSSPPLPTTPTNRIYGLIASMLLQIATHSVLFNLYLSLGYGILRIGQFENVTNKTSAWLGHAQASFYHEY